MDGRSWQVITPPPAEAARERQSRWVKAVRDTALLNAAAAKLGFRYGGPFAVSGHHLIRSMPPLARRPRKVKVETKRAERTLEIERRLIAGACGADIADDLGVTRQWVHLISKRIGISGRRPTRDSLEKKERLARERQADARQRVEDGIHYRRTIATKALELRGAGMSWREIQSTLCWNANQYFLEFYPDRREVRPHTKPRKRP